MITKNDWSVKVLALGPTSHPPTYSHHHQHMHRQGGLRQSTTNGAFAIDSLLQTVLRRKNNGESTTIECKTKESTLGRIDGISQQKILGQELKSVPWAGNHRNP